MTESTFELKILNILSESMLDIYKMIETYKASSFDLPIHSHNPEDHKCDKQIELSQSSSPLSESKNVEAEVQKKKKIKKKKNKIPGMPKPPPNSFVLYLQERKYEIQKGSPSMSIAAVTSIASKEWKLLPQSKKNIYKGQYDESKLDYQKRKKKFMEDNREKILQFEGQMVQKQESSLSN